jgi:3-keto-5-aminohexanoate cleavage enzyme
VSSKQYAPPPIRPYEPLIINAAITGMVPTRDTVPHVPVTPEQIARETIRCAEAGASIVHLHARDEDGRPTWRKEVFAEFIPLIRRAVPDLVICVTTSGRNYPEVEKRGDALTLEGDSRPDMASLTLGSLNFITGPSVSAPDTITRLAETMRDRGIRPELEIFDAGMAYMAEHLADRGVLEPPFYANLMMGSLGTAPARMADLAHIVGALPDQTTWAVAGLGATQLPMNAMSVFAGGHVRTGLEDNPYFDYDARRPATNSGLVRRVAGLARIAGREVATPAQVRERLGLRPVAPRPFSIRPADFALDRSAMLAVLETANMHHVPSAEMHDLDEGTWHVAEIDGRIVGLCGFDLVDNDGELTGKTTLMAVHPDARGTGVGVALQSLRMGLMRDAGATKVITNADRPETITWYQRHFGYRPVGELAKEHEFGDAGVDRWTTLEAPLD